MPAQIFIPPYFAFFTIIPMQPKRFEGYFHLIIMLSQIHLSRIDQESYHLLNKILIGYHIGIQTDNPTLLVKIKDILPHSGTAHIFNTCNPGDWRPGKFFLKYYQLVLTYSIRSVIPHYHMDLGLVFVDLICDLTKQWPRIIIVIEKDRKSPR